MRTRLMYALGNLDDAHEGQYHRQSEFNLLRLMRPSSNYDFDGRDNNIIPYMV